MNKYLSDKFRIISFLSILLVVLLHSYSISGEFSLDNSNLNIGYNFFVQYFCSQGIARIAVPIFLCISGYLFFLKFSGTKSEFLLKYKKRLKSLLIPYLFWSIWAVVFFFLIQLSPLSKNYFSNEIINYPLVKILYIIFVNPIPYQLWFLRDLIVMIAFSPLIYWVIKFFRLVPILLLFIVWIEIFKFNFVIVSIESVFFFFIGAYFSIHNNEIFCKKLCQQYYLVFTFFWLLMTFIKTILAYINFNYATIFLLHKFCILFGIISIWSIYDILMMNKINPNKSIYYVSFYSFFIYAFHEPVLTIIKRVMPLFLGTLEISNLIIYFLNPLIVITISVLFGCFLKKHIPKFYGLITGGR